MRRRRFIFSLCVLCSAAVLFYLWMAISTRIARRSFIAGSVRQIATFGDSKPWAWDTVAPLLSRHGRVHALDQQEGWLADNIILMADGEWIAYCADCIHLNHRVGDLFIGRASDGKWYFTTYHFCIGMMELRDQPKTLEGFTNQYSVHQFNGDPKSPLRATWPHPSPNQRGPRIYQSHVNPALPDFYPLKRVATTAIPDITATDPDLKNHGLSLCTIRYSHRFLEPKTPAEVSFEAIYADDKLSNGDASGVLMVLSNNFVCLSSAKGKPLLSYPLNGELKLPQDEVLSQIALHAITNFWPHIGTNLLSLEEIVCCDPPNGNDFAVTFRLTNPVVGPHIPTWEVQANVTTDGLVKEDSVEWSRKSE